ncbi:MAG: CDP-diacylglycerol--glycerol-3-phosphate 3-phosphatidyltransferase [Mesoaciditoga sp.]|uniref:CDP-diacylglycerol--glycerol-3-phosphate 3-phosphatidyltransferase n=1 Tax=Athalassotoga sp. TaxID=2022597 RepID=UPI000CB09690|nr:MAG: CDP-diacylglycerol--glycerol-3-phosphate 3-phosphatidyltransferase [Mesoaciditoga sp.]HEU23946.1 CDP-diacylglycerol--glycerol-3-phosphate 3-phosphatidyltransferase [Mesoaciditoga lauensis]
MRITIATRLTLLRIFFVIPFMVFALITRTDTSLAAFIIFIAASVTDFLDGRAARSMNEVTTLGKFFDQMADKILVDAAFLVFLQLGYVQSWFVIVVIARDSAISGLRMIAASKGKIISASWWGKFKTTFQMVFIIFVLFYRITPVFGWTLNVVLMWIALVMTVISGIEYFVKNWEALKD